MKLCVAPRPPVRPAIDRGYHRLMSDYEVNLVNDSMQEFYVRFYGPAESECAVFRARESVLTDGPPP